LRAVSEAPRGLEALALVMRYIFVTNRVDREALSIVLERELGMEAKNTMMTTGEELIEQGSRQASQRILLRQLHRRFGDEVNAEVERRIAAAPMAQLEIWIDRVLSAATLTELLAD
jgi:hypothetical protein